MKVRVKYSKTRKFVVTLSDQHDPTLSDLRQEIRKVVETEYNESVREPLDVSLNGTDPLRGSDNESLRSLGVVPGDLLTVLTLTAGVSLEAEGSRAEAKVPRQPQHLGEQEIPAASSSSSEDCTRSTKEASCTTMEEKPRLLREVRDGRTPQWLQEKLSEYQPASVSEAINLIVHYIMTECDFQKTDGEGSELPAGWRERVTTFHYASPTFPDFRCDLVLMTKKGLKQIMACFPQQEDDIDITVNIVMKDYFTDTVQSPITSDDFINVSLLVRTLRDRLLHPLQVCAHELLGVPAPWHLAGVPYELLINIACLLTYKDVLRLRETCHRLQSVMDDNTLWMKLYKRDFTNLYDDVDKTVSQNWKVKYQEAVRRRKEWNRLRDDDNVTFVLPHHPFAHPVTPYPSQPYPGMPRPRGDYPYPPQPHPVPNPFYDPDSPYFSGDIPPMPGAFPGLPDPSAPLGPFHPSPGQPFQPPFMPPRPRNPRGPRFDFF